MKDDIEIVSSEKSEYLNQIRSAIISSNYIYVFQF